MKSSGAELSASLSTSFPAMENEIDVFTTERDRLSCFRSLISFGRSWTVANENLFVQTYLENFQAWPAVLCQSGRVIICFTLIKLGSSLVLHFVANMRAKIIKFSYIFSEINVSGSMIARWIFVHLCMLIGYMGLFDFDYTDIWNVWICQTDFVPEAFNCLRSYLISTAKLLQYWHIAGLRRGDYVSGISNVPSSDS